MKKLILLFLIITNIFAGKIEDSSGNLVYSFIVENGTMVDTYFNIFHTIASMFQSNDYLEILKISFLLGGFLIFTMSITNFNKGFGVGSLKDFLKYLLICTFLLIVMFSHKSSIIIKTNAINSFCPAGITNKESLISSLPTTGVVVGNIPEVLAWTFSLINEVGRETTRLATMGFTAVDANLTTNYSSKSDYATYLQGINTVLNSKLSNFVSDYQGSDKTTLLEGFNSLHRDCIAAPASNTGASGQLVMNAISNTGNIRLTLTDYFTSGDIVSYLNPTYPDKNVLLAGFTVNGIAPKDLLGTLNGEIYTCGQIWTTVDTLLNALEASDKLLCSGNLKDYWNAQTLSIFTGDPSLTGSVAGKSIVMNAAISNQMYDLKNNISPAEISYASGKTMANLVHENIGQGFYLAEMLPYLQMGMRAVMYAFFPFVFIVILLPGGISVLKNYLQTLIWIELWTPLAAVLNMFLSLMATDKFAEMYQTNGMNNVQGLNLLTDSTMLAGLAGYLYASIPAFTWLLMKSSASLLTGLSEGLASKLNANLTSDSINKDYTEKESARKEKISLAEKDMLSAEINANEKSGNFDQKERNIDKSFGLASIETKLDILKNSTDFGVLLDSPDSQRNTGALVAKQKEDIKGLTEEKLRTGELDRNGNIVTSKNESVAESGGEKKAINKLSMKEEMSQTLKYTNENLNKSAEVLGSKEFGETVKQIKEYDYQKEVTNSKDSGKMIANIAYTKAMKETIDEFTEQSKQIQLGFYKQNEDSWINRNDLGEVTLKDRQKFADNVKNVSSADGTTKAVDNLTQQDLRDIYSKEDRVFKNLVNNAENLGVNNVDTMDKKIDRMDNIVDLPGSEKGKFNNISEKIGFASTIGSAKEMYRDISESKKAESLVNIISPTTMGIMQSTSFISDLIKQTAVFDNLTKYSIGFNSINEALKDKNMSIDSINENARLSMNKEYDIQKAIIADSALANLNDSVDSYNSLLNQQVAIGLTDTVGSGNIANANIVNEYVDTKSTNKIEDSVGLSVMVSSATIHGSLSIINNLFANLIDLNDYDRDKKNKTKEQIAEENRKKRIEELQNKKQRGETLSSKEENELRRKIGEQNKLDNIRKDSEGRQAKIKELMEKQSSNNLTNNEKRELKQLMKIDLEDLNDKGKERINDLMKKGLSNLSKEEIDRLKELNGKKLNDIEKKELKELIKKSVNNLSTSESQELRRLKDIENKTNFNFEEKKISLTKQLKSLATINGLAKGVASLGRGGIQIAGQVGRGMVLESLGLAEIELAVSSARTLGAAAGTAGLVGAAGGTALATGIVASVNDNLDTTSSYKRGSLDLMSLKRKGIEASENGQIGIIGSINVSENGKENHIVEFERTVKGDYNFIINGNRYSSDFTDSDFKDKEGRVQNMANGNRINQTYFIESLDDAFKGNLKGVEIQSEINGALSVSHTMNEGLKSSFVANVKEWAVETFVPTDYSASIKK